ncbi:p24 family protein delta-1 [Enteropsectra breve]|nr:p24 family protein delta-1 [Enteropsectra breve]
MLLLWFLQSCLAEIFEFNTVNEQKKIEFVLEADNINTGYFKVLPNAHANFKVEIINKTENKILYKMSDMEVDKEYHFSFSNSKSQEADVIISSKEAPGDSAADGLLGMVEMKFESKLDTFNKDVSKKSQIEPAIYALEHLLKMFSDVTASSKLVSSKMENLRAQSRGMIYTMLVFSILSLLAYAIGNISQLVYMKKYLREKKYL